MADYVFGEYFIPHRMMTMLDDYVKHGRLSSDFLRAVLSNDLIEACGKADAVNLQNLPAYAAWMYNVAPPNCYGSVNKVNTWLDRPAAQLKVVPPQK